MSGAVEAIPDINDLVRVTLGDLDDPESEDLASDVPSRIEGLILDPKTGRVLSYEIAAPWFSGNLELPKAQAGCSLQWPSSRGICFLPVAFEVQETTDRGLRVWRMRITGPMRRQERRQYVRIPWLLPTGLEIRRDFKAFEPKRRRLLELSGVRAAMADLPDSLQGQALNVSEGGLLCLTSVPVLPAHLPLITRFTIEATCFVIPAHVVWSLIRKINDKPEVESALAFDDPGQQGDVLRPLLFEAQMKARRAALK